jgi:hypothetical protein
MNSQRVCAPRPVSPSMDAVENVRRVCTRFPMNVFFGGVKRDIFSDYRKGKDFVSSNLFISRI